MNIRAIKLVSYRIFMRKLRRKIIVASLPRSGSTLVWRAITGLNKIKPSEIQKISNVIKLHKFSNKYSNQNYKTIFLFGDAINSVISTHLNGKDRYTIEQYLSYNNHFRNCGYNWDLKTKKDIFKEDFLNYEKIFDDWTTNNLYSTICVRYEKLYENIDVINNFLGFNLHLPNPRQRKTNHHLISEEQLRSTKITYSNLIDKIDSFPDIKTFNIIK